MTSASRVTSRVRRLRYELTAMALVVLLAAVSVVATFASARDGDLVFCRLVDGSVVIGVTTDCSGAVPSIADPPLG